MQMTGSTGLGVSDGKRLRAAVVDDDPAVLRTVGSLLELEDFDVMKFENGQTALDQFRSTPPDIAIVDLIMPRLDGMELVRQIRNQWDFPVIMVTAGSDEVDEALGLRLGADDYVHKPFATRLLLERVRALLRRTSGSMHGSEQDMTDKSPETSNEAMVRGPLAIDAERHEVTWHGQLVTLTVTEFQLLEALARRPGVVKTRDQLMDIAYTEHVYVDDRTIDSHIKRVRKKMRKVDPEFCAIETLYGIGYRFSIGTGEAAIA